MPVVKITGPGLAAIALAVTALWGCFVGEKVTMRQARQEHAQVMREMYRLRQRMQQPQPVSAPAIRAIRPARPSAG